VTFHVTIPKERLARSGVQFVWVRARDAAGNWGSPRFFAVPNFEEKPVDDTAGAPTDAIFQDEFKSLYQWTHLSGSRNRTETASSTYLATGSGLSSAALRAPVGVFRLAFEMRHEAWKRAGIVWITDLKGGHGYGVRWDSSVESTADGQGLVSLLRLDREGPATFEDQGERIGRSVPSGRPALDGGYARFELARASDGTLTVSINGRVLLTEKDSTFSLFQRLLVRGNTGVSLGSIKVTDGRPE
jgi:hypothetical protein